jgi:formamidopyrimidine-DNA glycosylase
VFVLNFKRIKTTKNKVMDEIKELLRDAWKQGYSESQDGIYNNDGTFEDWYKEQFEILNKHIVVGRSEQYCINCGGTKLVYDEELTKCNIKCPDCT